jgi:hypothetical protein
MKAAALLFAAVLSSPSAAPERPALSRRPASTAAAGPRIEVAFVLDTTGSMGGLIEGAKRRIWSIARRIGEGRPRPDLHIALVGYRDVGDAYVTRVYDLTADMDAVSANLAGFQAQGGGDGPEHVSAALADAVSRVSWSEGHALRVIFLVGDAPPHTDYQDGFDYRRHVQEARARGIALEAIQCGDDPTTAAVWREAAGLGGGHYARIDADGGMPVAVTPVDAELSRLNAELASTVVAAGSRRDRAQAEGRLAARKAMSAPVAAEAAPYFAESATLAAGDLVDLPKVEQQAALADADRRPDALRGRTDAEALAHLEAQKARREALRARIRTLSRERERLLAPAKDAFDETVVANLRVLARRSGLTF